MANRSYLEKSLIFYGSYHNNFYNQVVHLICIPVLVFTAAVWGCYINITDIIQNNQIEKFVEYFDLIKYEIFPKIIAQNLNINLALILIVSMCVFYFYLEFFAGVFNYIFLFIIFYF